MDPNVIGRFVEVQADLEQVQVRAEVRLVVQHTRVWARGQTTTYPTPT